MGSCSSYLGYIVVTSIIFEGKKMHALRPRLNTLSSHTMTMLMVIVAVGSSVSYMQLNSQRPEVAVGVSKIHFLYGKHDSIWRFMYSECI